MMICTFEFSKKIRAFTLARTECASFDSDGHRISFIIHFLLRSIPSYENLSLRRETICTDSIKKLTIFSVCLETNLFCLAFICLLKICIRIRYKVKNQINRIHANAISLYSIVNYSIVL